MNFLRQLIPGAIFILWAPIGLLVGIISASSMTWRERRKAREEIRRRKEMMASRSKVRRPNKGYTRRKRKWAGVDKDHPKWYYGSKD